MPSTFADLLPVQQISAHQYSVELKDAWCIGSVPNGGFVTSSFIVAARTHMQKTHPSRSQSDIINLHLEFLRRTSAGPAIFTVKDIKIGSRISNLHLTLSQHQDPSDPTSPIQDEVQGYITISAFASETGPTQDTKYRLLPPPRPTSLEALIENKDENYIRRRGDPYGTFRRATKNVQMYLLKPSARPPGLSPAIADQWVRFTPLGTPDGLGLWTNDSLGLLVDIFPQLYERFINNDLEDMLLSFPSEHSDQEIKALAESKKLSDGSAAFWYPTLLLNLDVKKKLPEQGVEWLFTRLQAKKIQNGRFDLHVEVWDDPINGELVATSTHASLVVSAARNMTRSSGKKQKDSKI